MSNQSILEANLGVTFIQPNLLKEALTHRSYLNENDGEKNSNERLEFLGDSVLSILVSTELYKRYPNFPEGKLTNLRSSLVRSQTLAKIARKLCVGDYILLSRGEEKGGGRLNQSLLADTFEAILGAIYLDQGIEVARKYLEIHLFPLIETIPGQKDIFDYKSKLQEVIQESLKQTPIYGVEHEEGPDHDKIFTVTVTIGNETLGSGTGKSKQEAQQNAARTALEPFETKRYNSTTHGR